MEFPELADAKEWLRRWVAFIGLRRLVAGTLTAVVAATGGWLLVRPSGASIESMLPRASGSSLVSPMTTSQRPADIVVHVAGAVRKPGVYRLPSTARVVDAVTMAGGATPTADLENINLAQTIVDTEQIFVPKRSAPRSVARVEPRLRPRRDSSPRSSAVTTTTPGQPAQTPGLPTSTARVNLNTATASQLDTLPGVGPTTARAIISYRAKNGPFKKVEDLLNVAGIGPSKLAAMRDRVTV